MKFPRLRSLLLPILNILVVITLVYYLYVNADKFLGLLDLSTTGIICLLLLSSTSPLLNGFINTYMFQSLGAKLNLKDGFYLAAASTLANELPVSGGVFAKGYYLKHRHKLSYTKYFSASLAFFVCILAVNGLIGLAILAYWALFKRTFSPPLLWIGFGVMAAVLLVFLFPLRYKSMPAKIQVWIEKSLDGWALISQNLRLLLKLLGFQTGLMLVFAMRYWLAFHMISQNVTFSQSILFSSATVLTQLVSFAPGGLGVREAIVGSVSSALGFSMEGSVAAVSLDRLVSVIVTVILGWRSVMVLSKQISDERNLKN